MITRHGELWYTSSNEPLTGMLKENLRNNVKVILEEIMKKLSRIATKQKPGYWDSIKFK